MNEESSKEAIARRYTDERRHSMKTLKPVDEETYAKIGKAYLICSEYPEIFGEVTYKKFCSMFVDVVDEDEDEHEARIKAAAPEMYRILRAIDKNYEELNLDEPILDALYGVLRAINGEVESDE